MNNNAELKQRISLHCAAFGDDKTWTEAYIKYALKYEKNTTVVIDNDIVSTLYLLPMTWSGFEKPLDSLFINCLLTAEKHRYKGFATELLKITFAELNVPLITLLPFKTSFYLKQGFVSINRAEKRTSCGEGCLTLGEATVDDLDIYIHLYSSFAECFSAAPLRDKTYFEYLFNDALCQSKPKTVYDGNRIVGYVLQEDKRLREYAFLPGYSPNDIPQLKDVEYLNFGEGEPYMMGRLCNAVKFLSALDYNQQASGDLTFILTDKLKPSNDGCYTLKIENGILRKISVSKKKSEGPTLTAEQLTLLGLGQLSDLGDVPLSVRMYFNERKLLLWDIF